MREFIKGQITAFSERKCPYCRRDGDDDMSFMVNRIWNGECWLLLDSWAGKSLALELAEQPIDIGVQFRANQAGS